MTRAMTRTETTSQAERLQKILSTAGLASRREAERLIAQGRVTVNGRAVTTLGARADPRADVVAVDGERVRSDGTRRTIVLHKPRGVVSTLQDPEGRATVRDLLPDVSERLYPVGRLDLQTSGVLLLTNDGALAAGLQHPRSGVPRVYHAKVRGTPDAGTRERVRRGVRLPDGVATVNRIRIIEALPTKSWVEIVLKEGRWREVRRLCDAVGHPVEKLCRVRLGPVRLGTLQPGIWRECTPRELVALYEAAGIGGEAPVSARGVVAARAARRRRRRTSESPRSAPRRPGARRR
jgi:23S rRNA pseudouridine2605 synthase